MKKAILKPSVKRKLLVIFLLCLFSASALQLYTFGFADNFFLNWFRMFSVLFILVGTTVLAIVPGVNYLVNKL
ncbi:DUF2798 domain-containing protein [Pontibacter sp. JH31]|uniref:DUF2798 domain-containing protein n=1 Tax=Pontibacter aquaedesilientis TaxID=2766980 RepID=A0ABR7XI65_9BACT|nr:DUF2798 domain-containing protein [Pontibacter aquaedesilientis]MBD1397975.1 DUF2798 domain-containing protein [Pontibacter aquaedesilientis]